MSTEKELVDGDCTEAQPSRMLNGDGCSDQGGDRTSTLEKVLPPSLTGESVLVVGCRYGDVCFEIAKRGAKRIVGIDLDSDRIRQARLAAGGFSADVTFDVQDIERSTIDGSFDYVFCLGVLSHVRNPIGVIDKLISLTRKRLVFECNGLDDSHAETRPVLYVRKREFTGNAQMFSFSPKALKNALKLHRNVFATVQTIPSDDRGNFFCVCEKRRIERMIVIAGPTASGKTTCLKKLQCNELPGVAERLAMGDGSTWSSLSAHSLSKPTDPEIDKLLFHYDILRPYRRAAKTYERDEATDVLETAKEVTYLTIWTPPIVLQKQLQQSELSPHMEQGIFNGNPRSLELMRDYQNPRTVLSFYERWFHFCSTKPGEKLIVSFDGSARFLSRYDWEQEIHTSAGRR